MFDLDVLMLVVDDSPYGMRVPIQIGTLHIDMALNLATEEEKRMFNCQWKRAELAASLCMKGANAKADDSDESQPTFDLAQVNGSVHLTQDLSLLPFEDVTLKGLLKGHVKCSGYFKKSKCCSRTTRTMQGGGRYFLCCSHLYFPKTQFKSSRGNAEKYYS